MTETSISSLVGHIEEQIGDDNTGKPRQASTVDVLNPWNNKRIYELPQLVTAEVVASVDYAREFQPQWAEYSVATRAEQALALHDALVKHEKQILELLQLETGKAHQHAFEEFAGSVGSLRYYAKSASSTLRRRRTRSGVPVLTRSYVEHSPVGVVGVITPWNYPLALAIFDVIPALLAGNTVVQKVDNQTALTGLFTRQLAIDAGLPEAAWTIVVGDGAEVGNALTDNVDYVAFTGSTATGRIVASRAAARLIGCSLELGGKNPMIVLPGADVNRAAEIALAGALGNTGQLCVSIERVYVPNSSIDEFLKVIAKAANARTVGRTNDFSVDLGTLTGTAQLERVSGFVDDAVAKGARLIAGGTRLEEVGPNAYAPTVLTDIPSDARLDRSEVFGPIVQVYAYESVAEAIALANDTDYGLNASVVGPESEAIAVAAKLQAGSVNINEGYRASFASMESPMGGMKASGQGRRNGGGGLLRFTEARTVATAGGPIKLPTRAKAYNRLAPLLRLLNAVQRRLP
jgi:acyl-CoA reductase-like NAD-dependent aldehyde dehydrogenase